MTSPETVENPELIKFNHELANKLGLADTTLDADTDLSNSTAIFSGNVIPEGAEPLAMAYAGHQFGHFNPQLGDGRAILLGEIDTPENVHIYIQLKGSGQTYFSRNGDGRAALGPVLREYLLCEAMEKLGVPTTRALAVVTTGEKVAREKLLPAGILTRIATSYIRVGTFQYFSARDNTDAVKKLADFVIDSHYPAAKTENIIYEALLNSIIDAQAALIAKWMQIGFIHGVMNTDNMSIAGETIDYGPCAFMDYYNADQIYSSIDRNGRYAYSNQPAIGLWNLTRLAETFLPLLSNDSDAAIEIAKESLKNYAELYEKYWLEGMRKKVGFASSIDDDKQLIEELLNLMAEHKADFTLTFYYLSQLAIDSTAQDEKIYTLFLAVDHLKKWLIKWRKRLSKESLNNEERELMMRSVNPIYIPRNHQIEAAIRAAEDFGDFSLFHSLHDVLQKPYVLQKGKEVYMLPPEPNEIVEQTFCGT